MLQYDLGRNDYLKKLKKSMAIAILATSMTTSVGVGYVAHSKNEEVNVLRSEINKTEGKLQEANLLIEEKTNSLNVLDGNFKQLSTELKELQTDYLNLSKTYDNLVVDYKELQEDYATVNKQLKVQKESTVAKKNYSKTTSKISGDYSTWTRMFVESTGYTTYENGDELAGRKWGNLTKSGKPVKWGYVAVDPSVIPLGTQIYIPSLGTVFTAEDTGSAIKGNKIDVFFNSLDEAVKWGRKYNLEIYVNYK